MSKNWEEIDGYSLDGQYEGGYFLGKNGRRKDYRKRQAELFRIRVKVYQGYDDIEPNPDLAKAMQIEYDRGFSDGYSYFVTIIR